MKFKMAADAILNLLFLSILVTWTISGGSRLHYCKISFIYVNRRPLLFVQKSKMACCHLGFYFCLIFWNTGM